MFSDAGANVAEGRRSTSKAVMRDARFTPLEEQLPGSENTEWKLHFSLFIPNVETL